MNHKKELLRSLGVNPERIRGPHWGSGAAPHLWLGGIEFELFQPPANSRSLFPKP